MGNVLNQKLQRRIYETHDRTQNAGEPRFCSNAYGTAANSLWAKLLACPGGGKYGFNDSGTVVGIGPRVATGIFTLDAAGNLLNGKATSSLNGAIAAEAFSGPYTVNSDCTGTFSLDVFDPSSGKLLFTATLNLAWDDNMRELRFIFTSVATPDGKPSRPS